MTRKVLYLIYVGWNLGLALVFWHLGYASLPDIAFIVIADHAIAWFSGNVLRSKIFGQGCFGLLLLLCWLIFWMFLALPVAVALDVI